MVVVVVVVVVVDGPRVSFCISKPKKCAFVIPWIRSSPRTFSSHPRSLSVAVCLCLCSPVSLPVCPAFAFVRSSLWLPYVGFPSDFHLTFGCAMTATATPTALLLHTTPHCHYPLPLPRLTPLHPTLSRSLNATTTTTPTTPPPLLPLLLPLLLLLLPLLFPFIPPSHTSRPRSPPSSIDVSSTT